MMLIAEKIDLAGLIKKKIRKEGPVSFHDFMEMALYYPELGYYTSPSDKIGKDGDFYTSACVSSIFGTLIGRQLEEMYDHLGKGKFTIVEYGAGTGRLCRDILAYLQHNHSLYENLNYYIVEKNPRMRESASVKDNDKVSWYESAEEIADLSGCVLSNELVDNFAVHRVVMQNELMEVFVDDKDGFVEVLQPADQELKNYLKELKIDLPKGFRTEINLDAGTWLRNISKALRKGYVLTIDYGGTSSELYDYSKRKGTLACYHKHNKTCDPYVNVGKQDITSDVNFSALALWGFKSGLEFCGYRNQGDFLMALGFKDELKKYRARLGNDPLKYEKDAFISHQLIEDMGQKFKVIIQQKGSAKEVLQGMGQL